MNPNTTELLADVIVTAHRLTRVAAQATGSSTPSAIWHTLSILTTDGPSRIGELATRARVTQPSMTKVVQQLTEDELAYRIADVEDSRAWLIGITPAGSAALANWRVQLAVALQPMFSDLTATEFDTITRAVEILGSRIATDRKVA